MRARFYESVVLVVIGMTFHLHAVTQTCPETSTPTISSAQPPTDVCIPDDIGTKLPIDYFDDYSWRAFIALVWPAKIGSR